MKQQRSFFTVLIALAAVLALTACGGGDDGSSTAVSPPPPTLAQVTAVSTLPPPPLPTAVPTTDPAIAHLAGTYRFHPAEGIDTADYFLVLNGDGTAFFEEKPIGGEELIVDASGQWYLDGEFVVFDLLEVAGQPAHHEEMIHIKFVDGFPVIAEIKINDQFVHLENNAFTLGAGESSPLVSVLNQRLAAIAYLGFVDTGTDVYDENVRTAVVAFQQSQGLLPDGVLNEQTWVLLDNPQPPIPTPTPAAVLTDAPNINDLPTHNEGGQPILYLTFDDGPQLGSTLALLDVLDQYNAKATFFNVGTSVVASPDLVRECATRGHYVADHTWDHGSLEGMTHEQFVDEVERTRQAILNAAGDLFGLDGNVRYVRPPYGATDANTYTYAAELGMTIVLWTVDPQDWRRPGATIISDHIVSHAYPGAIILSHDGGGDRSQTIAAYQTALPQLQAQGYVFNTIFLP